MEKSLVVGLGLVGKKGCFTLGMKLDRLLNQVLTGPTFPHCSPTTLAWALSCRRCGSHGGANPNSYSCLGLLGLFASQLGFEHWTINLANGLPPRAGPINAFLTN